MAWNDGVEAQNIAGKLTIYLHVLPFAIISERGCMVRQPALSPCAPEDVSGINSERAFVTEVSVLDFKLRTDPCDEWKAEVKARETCTAVCNSVRPDLVLPPLGNLTHSRNSMVGLIVLCSDYASLYDVNSHPNVSCVNQSIPTELCVCGGVRGLHRGLLQLHRRKPQPSSGVQASSGTHHKLGCKWVARIAHTSAGVLEKLSFEQGNSSVLRSFCLRGRNRDILPRRVSRAT